MTTDAQQSTTLPGFLKNSFLKPTVNIKGEAHLPLWISILFSIVYIGALMFVLFWVNSALMDNMDYQYAGLGLLMVIGAIVIYIVASSSIVHFYTKEAADRRTTVMLQYVGLFMLVVVFCLLSMYYLMPVLM